MKIPFWIWAWVGIVALTACEEVPPVITPQGAQGQCAPVDEALLRNQKRGVFVEEFSGARCVNCPAGAEALKSIQQQYGADRVHIVSIHTGFFARPYAESKYDLRTKPGDLLLTFLGTPIGYPSAVINRTLFSGENDLQLTQGLWPGFVAQELDKPVPAGMHLSLSVDSISRVMSIKLSVLPNDALYQLTDPRIGIALTEDNIQDYQLTPIAKDSAYIHRHVLRDMLTPIDGQRISSYTALRSAFCLSWQYTVPTNWKMEDVSVLGFIGDGQNKQVLHAVAAHL